MIDWSQAPYWAKWAAIDDDGSVWFYSKKPYAKCTGAWGMEKNGKALPQKYPDWENSLQERPKDGEK